MTDLLIDVFSIFLTTKVFIILLFIIILIIISYKLYNNNKSNTYIENFSSLKKLKKKSKNTFKNVSNKNEKQDATFNDLMKKSEAFSKEKDKLASFTDTIEKYKKSFNNKKFKNNSKNTAESFEKFALYKEKFFDLFK